MFFSMLCMNILTSISEIGEPMGLSLIHILSYNNSSKNCPHAITMSTVKIPHKNTSLHQSIRVKEIAQHHSIDKPADIGLGSRTSYTNIPSSMCTPLQMLFKCSVEYSGTYLNAALTKATPVSYTHLLF